MRITDEQNQLFEEALQNKKAFTLDWKFPIEDIVFNIKTVLPNLDISDLPEKQINGDWIQTMVIDKHEYTYQSDSPSLILEAIATVNVHLRQKNQYLVFMDTEDDDYCFILISLDDLPKYLEMGFKEIG